MTQSLQAGQVLVGKYRVDRILGEGGMGYVVAATHLHLEKPVALKFLQPALAKSPEIVERFSREARAASRIQSEHVAKVLDVGTLEDGAPFMVMEYLEGCDLAALIRQRGALPGRDAIEYVLQACEALAEAHAAGIVHRDLKPANLFLTTRPDGSPSVKVLDFGISKATIVGGAPGGEQGLTQTSAVMGSPQYMSPEQLRSPRSVDQRTDIWALGIVLHEMLTGEVAFKADTVPELYVAILQNPPEPVRRRRPEAPPGVEAILFRCLEKDPARRFANVAELAGALAEFAPPRALPSVERIGRIIGGAGYAPPRSFPAASGPVAPSGPLHGAPPSGSSTAPSVPAQHPYPGPGYGYAQPYGGQAPPGPPRAGTSPAFIALGIIVALVVLSGAGCMMCVCIGEANAAHDVPFQPGAAWTTLSASGLRGPEPTWCTLAPDPGRFGLVWPRHEPGP